MTKTYLGPRERWTEDEVRRLPAGARILDVGFVGASTHSSLHRALRTRRPDLVWLGVDLDVEGVVRSGLTGVSVADAARLPFADGVMDAILFLEVFEHVYEESAILSEFARVTSPGGRLILTTPNAWYWVRMLRYWLLGSLKSKRSVGLRRAYLGAADHLRFYEPFSLMNELSDHGWTTEGLATVDHRIPGLARLSDRFLSVDLRSWPFDRLGGYVCLMARRD